MDPVNQLDEGDRHERCSRIRALGSQRIVGVVAELAVLYLDPAASVESRRIPKRIVALVAGCGGDDFAGGYRAAARHNVEGGVHGEQSGRKVVNLNPHPVGQ